MLAPPQKAVCTVVASDTAFSRILPRILNKRTPASAPASATHWIKLESIFWGNLMRQRQEDDQCHMCSRPMNGFFYLKVGAPACAPPSGIRHRCFWLLSNVNVNYLTTSLAASASQTDDTPYCILPCLQVNRETEKTNVFDASGYPQKYSPV